MFKDQRPPLMDPNRQLLTGKSESSPMYPCHHDKGYIIIKRVIDVIGSLGMLLALCPLFFLIPLLIKLETPGPVFYRQKKAGKNGRVFICLKFRTMRIITGKEEEAFIRDIINMREQISHDAILHKFYNNPRITRVGRFLIRTSLDELPQIINVLKGDMSLVGPRPSIPYELGEYKEWHKERLTLKPGLTGLSQVSGSSVNTFDEIIKLDIKYMKECSAWLDLKILLKTPYVVLTGRNF
jgi:lipopolysaccharide/colanic/teichoic acid biosynthesis glycosyltransferase